MTFDRDQDDAILIAGPTASGKSALAVEMARAFGGWVINADSMQVYRELSVLTARPTAEEMGDVPHLLYGFVDAREAYSVGRFVRDAAQAIEAARAAGAVPVVVGGTGLYFKALLEGLSPMPPIDPEIRSKWRAAAERMQPAALHGLLKLRDPEMAARLRPSDPQRLVRALEVLESTGRSLAEWQQVAGASVLDANRCLKLLVTLPRDTLYARCDARLEAMFASGAWDEMRSLSLLQLDPGLPAMRALGVKPMLEALTGQIDPEEALARAQLETRRYAKRQMTWHRRHMIAWKKWKMEY